MKTHTANYFNTLIEVAEDCSAQAAQTPPLKSPKTQARLEYEMLIDQPYRHTSDDVLYETKGKPKGASREEFFSKGQPCFRASALAKRYGFGIHSDEQGKITLLPVESEAYLRLVASESVRKLRAMRNRK